MAVVDSPSFQQLPLPLLSAVPASRLTSGAGRQLLTTAVLASFHGRAELSQWTGLAAAGCCITQRRRASASAAAVVITSASLASITPQDDSEYRANGLLHRSPVVYVNAALRRYGSVPWSLNWHDVISKTPTNLNNRFSSTLLRDPDPAITFSQPILPPIAFGGFGKLYTFLRTSWNGNSEKECFHFIRTQ